MAKLVFDEAGKHFYETGVSKCVLFVASEDGATYEEGVAWNGVTSITESPSGAEASAIYADNIKYLSLLSVEEFGASIEAYTYPDEFAVCDGSADLGKGVSIGQQPRRKFALCYRTEIGNDATSEAGYKLHIIYGALAAPSERAYETINDSPSAMTMSWTLSTTPVAVTGHKPTAHIEIDSIKAAGKIKAIEDVLYGTDTVASKLLTPDELVDLLK